MKYLKNCFISGFKNAGKGRFLSCTLFFLGLFCLSTLSTFIIGPVAVYSATVQTGENEINIRSDAGMDHEILGMLQAGTEFEAIGEKSDEEGNVWLEVEADGVRGYVLKELTVDPSKKQDKSSEENPESEEESDGPQQADPEDPEDSEVSEEEIQDSEDVSEDSMSANASQPSWSGRIQSDAEFEASLMDFPESYRQSLRAIHSEYPNYTFSADYIDMDFEALVDAQVGKKVSSYYASSWKAMYDESFGYYENYDWDTGEWMNSEGMFTYASRETIAHFIDPRNFLNSNDIYMFMRQSYSPAQSIDDLRSIIAGSFLSEGYIPDEEENDRRLNGDYAAVLMEAAQISGSSPYVLAASILLEHGYSGETPLISGYYEADDGTEYKKYYNFFDIGATGSDSNNVIQNGLEYAKEQGWTSRYLSIVDGAIWITDSYINNGQDTYYYKEYNVINGSDALWHQFSTGVMTAYSSSALLRDTLSGNYYAALDFRIPVYSNMPAEPAQEPDYNDNLNNYYFTDMQATGLEPEFTMANRNYTMTVTDNAEINIAVPKWAVYEGESAYTLHPGDNEICLDVRSQTGYLRTYTIDVASSGDFTLTVHTVEGNRLKISDQNAQDPEDPESISGDANGDGRITSLDYIVIKNHIMEEKVITERYLLTAADYNGDGKITSLDYIGIKNYIMAQ